MKTFSKKRRILASIICFSLLVFVNIGCETENEIDEILQAKEQLEKTESKTKAKKGIKTGRTRIKQRRQNPTSYFRASIIVNNDNKDEVSTIALEIESKKGVLNETETYYLDYYTTVKKDKYYTFADIKFDGKDLDNQEITVNITLLDAKKKPISTSTTTILIEGLSKATIGKSNRNPSIFFYPKSTRLGLTADIDNNEDNDVAEAGITINDLQGNTTSFNVAPKKNNTIKTDFSFEKETISKQMNVTIILKDFYGDEISTFKEEVSLESNLKVGKATIKQNSNGLYDVLVKVKKDAESQVNTVFLEIKKQEGISKDFTATLKYSATKKDVKFFTIEDVTLNIKKKSNELVAEITLLDKNKKNLGSWFHVVAIHED